MLRDESMASLSHHWKTSGEGRGGGEGGDEEEAGCVPEPGNMEQRMPALSLMLLLVNSRVDTLPCTQGQRRSTPRSHDSLTTLMVVSCKITWQRLHIVIESNGDEGIEGIPAELFVCFPSLPSSLSTSRCRISKVYMYATIWAKFGQKERVLNVSWRPLGKRKWLFK
jgi:hypothetical protein